MVRKMRHTVCYLPGAAVCGTIAIGFLMGAVITCNWVNYQFSIIIDDTVAFDAAYYEGKRERRWQMADERRGGE